MLSMHSWYSMRLDVRGIISLIILMTNIIIISSPSTIYATSSGVNFYSVNSPQFGVKSLEALIAKWWNWWNAVPSATATNWPECIKADGGMIGNSNQSIVFIGNPAQAVEKNVNARNQKCEISSNQLLYLTVYPGECSTGVKQGEGEEPNMKSPADLLACAQDSNKVMKLMQVKVDGTDVSSNIIRQSTSQPFNYIVPQDNAFQYPQPIAGGTNYSMAENYYLLFKPLPIGHHIIQLEVIRQPLQSDQPVEHDIANWDINVIP
jgi:hypothetical protein